MSNLNRLLTKIAKLKSVEVVVASIDNKGSFLKNYKYRVTIWPYQIKGTRNKSVKGKSNRSLLDAANKSLILWKRLSNV